MPQAARMMPYMSTSRAYKDVIDLEAYLSVFICPSWYLNICVFVIRDMKEKAAHFFNKFTVCVLKKVEKEIYKKKLLLCIYYFCYVLVPKFGTDV